MSSQFSMIIHTCLLDIERNDTWKKFVYFSYLFFFICVRNETVWQCGILNQNRKGSLSKK